jgi:hypothetical protein
VSNSQLHTVLNYLISAVWVINGLFCKVLNLVPRHQEIVARILGVSYSQALTKSIGLLEILMAIWILSGIRPKLNVVTQMAVIASMNIIEFLLAPDLLLFGKLNSAFALLFILLIYWNEFVLTKRNS